MVHSPSGTASTIGVAFAAAGRLVARGAPVLVEGEPGTGKTALAREAPDAAGVSDPATVDLALAGLGGADGVFREVSVAVRTGTRAVVLRHLEAVHRGRSRAGPATAPTTGGETTASVDPTDQNNGVHDGAIFSRSPGSSVRVTMKVTPSGVLGWCELPASPRMTVPAGEVRY